MKQPWNYAIKHSLLVSKLKRDNPSLEYQTNRVPEKSKIPKEMDSWSY